MANNPVAEPTLPVVLWVHFKADGSRGPIVDHDIAMLPGETREPYVQRPLQCRECRHYTDPEKRYEYTPVCSLFAGLRKCPPDGSGSCSYAEPRESEGENG